MPLTDYRMLVAGPDTELCSHVLSLLALNFTSHTITHSLHTLVVKDLTM